MYRYRINHTQAQTIAYIEALFEAPPRRLSQPVQSIDPHCV